jgi:hypothetical protein
MNALTEERKQQIIEEEPGGVWQVLNEESSRERTTVGDLLSGDLEGTDSNGGE